MIDLPPFCYAILKIISLGGTPGIIIKMLQQELHSYNFDTCILNIKHSTPVNIEFIFRSW